MNLLAALVLLSSASSEFNQQGFLDSWRAGLRGMPDASIVQVDGDSCLRLSATTAEPTPGIDDLVRSFPRPVLASERPFAQAHIWLPPFEQWPTTNQNYAGFRLIITREQGGGTFVWPGIFISRSGGNPAFVCRVLGDHFGRPITQAGWWTLGVSCSGAGTLQFHAASGLVALTESDRFFADPDPFTTVRSFDGWFLQVSSSLPLYVGAVQLWGDVPPLTIERAGGAVTLTTGYPGMTIERSTDLATWFPLTGTSDPITQSAQFYRLSQ